MNVIRKTVIHKIEDGIDGVFSDWRVIDAMDDQVGDGTPQSWDLKAHNANPIMLVGHRQDFVGGTTSNTRVDADGVLRGRIHLAKPSTSPRHAELHALVSAGILKGISVGFFPREARPRPGSKTGGQIYTRCSLVEVSICAVPANSAALLEAKALGVSKETIAMVFKQDAETPGERIRRARRTVRRAREMLAKITDPRSRMSLLKAIAHIEAIEKDRIAEQEHAALMRSIRERVAREQAEAVAKFNASPLGQQRLEQQRTLAAYSAHAKAHADPPKKSSSSNDDGYPTWRGQKIKPKAWRYDPDKP
jgi:HK97 family phage prohead protease